MASYVLSFVIQTAEADFSTIVDDTVAALTADGHTPTEVRVQSDAGEQVIDVTVEEEPAPVEEEPEAQPAKSESASKSSK